jgi:hypothetical protein
VWPWRSCRRDAGDCWRYRPGVTAWPGGTPPENAADCQRTSERKPESWPPWGWLALLSRRDRVALGKLPPGDCWRYRPGVTAWPGDCWPDHTGERRQRTPKLQGRRGMATGSARDYQNAGGRPGDCWRYCPSVTAWHGGTPPENAGELRDCRNAGNATGKTPPGEAGRIITANASRKAAALGMAGGSARDCQNAGNCWRYRPGVTAWPWRSCRRAAGNCWRYRPGVTAWPGGKLAGS